MQPKGPSRTVVTTASHRATDPLRDDDPKIMLILLPVRSPAVPVTPRRSTLSRRS